MINTYAAAWADLEPKAREEVLAEVAKEAEVRFENYYNSIIEAIGLKELKGDELLQHFNTRTPDQWAMLQMQFPFDYAEQMKRWGILINDKMRKVNSQLINSDVAQVTRFEGPGIGY